ncbi:MAG: hypothetical protein ABI036_00200 [Fibrobacteria bacterium]
MVAPSAGRKRGRSALTGIAAFFRQLSLFDPILPDPAPEPRDALPPALPRPPDSPAPEREPSPDQPFSSLTVGPYAHIEVVLKPRLWDSWRVAWTRRNESLRLDVPGMLAEAPLSIKESVLEWAVLVTLRGAKRRPEIRARRAELEARIREHLHAPLPAGGAGTEAEKRRLARNRRRMDRLEPKGVHHDLEAAFRAINAEYFQGLLQAKLTWSARLGGLSTHSVAQDGEGGAYHLISISRGYDNAEVTPEILGGVVYHECLHIAIPPRREGGRRVVHGADFRAREREYAHFRAWRNWHRHGLPKALKRLQRERRR